MLPVRRLAIGLSAFVALAGQGCAKRPPGAGSAPSSLNSPNSQHWASAGKVVGRKSGELLVGVSVAVGASISVTDADGRFAVPAGNGPYDVILMSADRSLISVYLGIVRRDPVLAHLEPEQPRPRAHHAELRGKLSGAPGQPLAGEVVQVGFFSERGRAQDVVRLSSETASAEFGPLLVSWDGPDVLSGQFLALQTVQRGPALSATFAHSAVTLNDGAKVKLDVPMTPAPIEHRPPDFVPDVLEEPSPTVLHRYHVVGGGSFHGVNSFRRGTGYDSPDLSAVGATLCVDVFVSNPYLDSAIRRCAPPAESLAALTLHAAPVLLEPKRGAVAQAGMSFSWSPVPDASYALELVPERGPSDMAPSIVIYTSRPHAVWPDLQTLGVRFPKPLNTYRVTVRASGPHKTLDDALAPRGAGIAMPTIAWKATSNDLDIPVRPPLGPEEARCDYLNGDGTIRCSSGIPGSIEPSAEWYALTAINNVIRNYPEFAAATGLHCVKDCASARAFVEAMAKYREAHPGFDSDQPLGPRPPLPPLPHIERR